MAAPGDLAGSDGDWDGDWVADSVYDFAWRPGEDVDLDTSTPEALAAARRFRDVLGRFASGITVVTGLVDGVPVGLTCQSFSSVSLSPPLVLFVPARTSRAWPQLRRAGAFCVNFLAADQIEASNQMAGRGGDKFAGIDWTPAPGTGSPQLGGALGWVDCTLHAVHDGGDHDIAVGRVVDLGLDERTPDGEALIYFGGRYRRTADHGSA